MSTAHSHDQAAEDRYRALLAVSEAIVSCRDLPALFRALSGQLVQVAHYDALSLVLHEAATNTMRLHLLAVRCRSPFSALAYAASADSGQRPGSSADRAQRRLQRPQRRARARSQPAQAKAAARAASTQPRGVP